RAGGTGAGGAGVGGTDAGGAGAGGARAVDLGGAVRPRPYFVPLLQQVLGTLSILALLLHRLNSHSRRYSQPLQCLLLLLTLNSLTERPSPTVSHLLATAVTDPSFESAAASALVAELLDFVVACRLDYASALVAESASANPPSVGGDEAAYPEDTNLSRYTQSGLQILGLVTAAPCGPPSDPVAAPYVPVTAPYGPATAPYGHVAAPHGRATAFYGPVAAPYGFIAAPYGPATAPYGPVTTPQGFATTPYGPIAAP
ncbi:unnamed protein product, partial [Closterium sp. NIES-54]